MSFSSLDPVVESLALELDLSSGTALWLADEQASSPSLMAALKRRQAFYLSNRFDQVEAMSHFGVEAAFNDFDSAILGVNKFAQIFVRVPKQRPLAHHLINTAADLLDENGSLWIAGLKGEGVKTQVKRAEQRLGSKGKKVRAAGALSLYEIELVHAGSRLDDDDYAALRQVAVKADTVFWSKPGIYGWNKIDQGSQLLVDVMTERYVELRGKTVLDLGCGYGFLALAASRLQPTRVVATDNHAGAIAAARKNLSTLDIETEVIAADAGASITEKFNLILCNPPFHRGFGVTPELHQKFFDAIARLLIPDGRALVVLNSFLKIDRLGEKTGLKKVSTWHFEEFNFTVFELALQDRS